MVVQKKRVLIIGILIWFVLLILCTSQGKSATHSSTVTKYVNTSNPTNAITFSNNKMFSSERNLKAVTNNAPILNISKGSANIGDVLFEGEPAKAVYFEKGTTTNLNTIATFKNAITMGKNNYDVRITVNGLSSNYSEERGQFFFRLKDNASVGVNIGIGVPTSANTYASSNLNFKICKAGTTTPVNIKGLVLRQRDLDKGECASLSEIPYNKSTIAVDEKTTLKGNSQNKMIIGTTELSGDSKNAYEISSTKIESGNFNLSFGTDNAGGRKSSRLIFYAPKYKVTYDTDGNSTISRSSDEKYQYENISNNPNTPNENYETDYWTADKNVKLTTGTTISKGSQINEKDLEKIVIEEDLKLTVHNKKIMYRIDTYVENGKITESCEVESGSDKEIIYTPNEGYQLESVHIDGEEKKVSSYTFTNIKENHDIEVYFEKIPKLEVTKKAKKENYKFGKEITYNVLIKQTVEGAIAKKVVIKDNFPKGMKLININCEESDCKTTENGYEIFLEELEDEFEFSYTVSISSEGLYENIVEGTSENAEKAEGKYVLSTKKPRIDFKKTFNKNETYNGDVVKVVLDAKQLEKNTYLEDVKIHDLLPDGMQYIDDTLLLEGNNCTFVLSQNSITVNSDEDVDNGIKISFDVKITKTSGEIKNIGTFDSLDYKNIKSEAKIIVKEPQISVTTNTDKGSLKKGETTNVNTLISIKDAPIVNGEVAITLPEEVKIDKKSIEFSDKTIKYRYYDGIIFITLPEKTEDIVLKYKLKAKENVNNLKIITNIEGDNIEEDFEIEETVIKKPQKSKKVIGKHKSKKKVQKIKKKRVKKIQKVKKLQKKDETPKTGDKYELWAIYLLTISSIIIMGLMVKKENSIKKLK